MQRTAIPVFFILAAFGLPENAGAANIYKWVDAEGLTHYSDAPPDAIETTLIDVPEPIQENAAADAEAGSDYYSIIRQWERMNQERLEREKLEVERARIRAAQKSAQPTTVYVQDDRDVRYVPLIYRDPPYRTKYHRQRYHYRGPGSGSYRPAPAPVSSWPTQ